MRRPTLFLATLLLTLLIAVSAPAQQAPPDTVRWIVATPWDSTSSDCAYAVGTALPGASAQVLPGPRPVGTITLPLTDRDTLTRESIREITRAASPACHPHSIRYTDE